MAESWKKVTGTDDYEVEDVKVVRRVNKTELEAEKTRKQSEITRLQTEIAQIDADIAQIDALEA